MSRSPRVLQVSTADVLGGAERIALNLHRAYAARDVSTAMAVGRKGTDDPSIFVIPNAAGGGPWRRAWWGLHRKLQPHYGRSGLARFAVRWAHRLAEPGRIFDDWRGREDFRYPGTRAITEACSFEPEVIHCHNLHGKYFDLRMLPALSRERPVFVTLHDAWMLAGHCAHSFDCERWRAGCGECPDVSIYPPLRRDGTAHNWAVKRNIYARCRLYVATPSQWLMDRVEASMLAPACVEKRVIPNGVDVSIYAPGEKTESRRRLNLPTDARILLFTGYRPAANPWKDFATLEAAIAKVRARIAAGPQLLTLAVGGIGAEEGAGHASIRHVPFVADEAVMADYYRAADVYVHAAKVDTFPNSVLEALACGTPVVATAVGGVPEQVVSANSPDDAASGDRHESDDAATGILVPPQDAEAMAAAIQTLLENESMRLAFARNAVADVARRFTLTRQADAYIAWYTGVLERNARGDSPGPG